MLKNSYKTLQMIKKDSPYYELSFLQGFLLTLSPKYRVFFQAM